MHDEELHNLYASPNIIRLIKPMRMRWADQVCCMGWMINSMKSSWAIHCVRCLYWCSWQP